ncbi:hypothetical protein HYE55_10655 [Aggregatibacter actinomycetemcomitans]|nr:hypothetical protein [Aggregatibacter actinomycetemcomitans]MBN6082486.1 hypothetical protein [Aggregatibacter actinomycetemcomitans]
MIKRKSLLISSNIDIEEQAINRGLTISYKDFSYFSDRNMLEQRNSPYKTIGGYASDQGKERKDSHIIYNLSIFTTENEVYHYPLPRGFPENIKEKKDNDVLYCQYVIYFYLAKPIIKSNIIEIPFKYIRDTIQK